VLTSIFFKYFIFILLNFFEKNSIIDNSCIVVLNISKPPRCTLTHQGLSNHTKSMALWFEKSQCDKQKNNLPSHIEIWLEDLCMWGDVPQPKTTPFSFAPINYCKLLNVIHPLLKSQVFNKPQNVKFHLRDLVLV